MARKLDEQHPAFQSHRCIRPDSQRAELPLLWETATPHRGHSARSQSRPQKCGSDPWGLHGLEWNAKETRTIQTILKWTPSPRSVTICFWKWTVLESGPGSQPAGGSGRRLLTPPLFTLSRPQANGPRVSTYTFTSKAWLRGQDGFIQRVISSRCGGFQNSLLRRILRLQVGLGDEASLSWDDLGHGMGRKWGVLCCALGGLLCSLRLWEQSPGKPRLAGESSLFQTGQVSLAQTRHFPSFSGAPVKFSQGGLPHTHPIYPSCQAEMLPCISQRW